MIDLASFFRIKPKATYELMSRKAGGRANLGFTELDHKNYLRARQQKIIIYGKAACLLGYIHEQLTKNSSFQYGVELVSIIIKA